MCEDDYDDYDGICNWLGRGENKTDTGGEIENVKELHLLAEQDMTGGTNPIGRLQRLSTYDCGCTIYCWLHNLFAAEVNFQQPMQ